MIIKNGSDLIPEQKNIIAIGTGDDYNFDIDESILKSNVVSIVQDIGVVNLAVINLSNGRTKEINMADVENQPTWTNDELGVGVAISDMDAWIEEYKELDFGSSAIYVSNSGTTITSNDTFDGKTIAQFLRAINNKFTSFLLFIFTIFSLTIGSKSAIKFGAKILIIKTTISCHTSMTSSMR